MSQAVAALETLDRFYANSTFVSYEEFTSFSAPWIDETRLAALFWVAIDVDGSIALRYSAEGTNERFLESEPFNESLIAVSRESITGHAARSRLIHEDSMTYIAVAVPTERNDETPSSSPYGCIIGVISPGSLIERIVSFEPPIGLPVWLKRADTIVYYHPPRLDEALGQRVDQSYSPRLRTAPMSVTFPGMEDLTIVIGASPAFMALRESPAPLIVALLGATASVLIGIWTNRLVKSRREAEDRAASLREQLERFFDMGIDLFCIADTKGKFRKLNAEWERCLGYGLADLEGANFLDFVHPDDRAATTEAVERLSAGNPVVAFVNRYRAKDGSYRFIEWRSAPSNDGTLIFAAARDISARIEAAEALESSLAQREALLKELHHRVKNNLQVLSSFASLEREGCKAREPDKMLMDLSARIQAMAMAHEKLSESGGFETVPLSEYLRDLAAQIITEHSGGKIGLTVELEDCRIGIDLAIPLGIIVAEFVTNAIKYAFEGVAEPRISMQSSRLGNQFVITIKDNGPGLGACEGREGLGRKIIEALTAQIGGSFRYTREGAGCVAELTFPSALTMR